MADSRASLLIVLKDMASKGLVAMGSQVDKLKAKVEKSGPVFGGIAGALGLIGTAALRASGQMEQWTVAFETMLGDADKAKVLLNDIREFAAETPFELPQVIEGSKNLLAFGFAAEEIIEQFKVLGNIAAGVGTQKLPSLVLAFGKIKTKGKATMEELNILLEAGVPILDELAKGFGVNKQEIFKMVTTGTVGFQDVSDALAGLTGEGGLFFDLMEKQSKTLFGVLSNISDNVFQIAVAFGDELLPAAKSVAEAIQRLTGTVLGFNRTTKLAILTVASLTLAFSGLVAGVAAFNFVAPSFIAAWGVITGVLVLAKTAIVGTTVATTGMNVALGVATVKTGGLAAVLGVLAIPLAGIAVAVGALTVTYIAWGASIEKANKAMETQNRIAKSLQERVRDGKVAVQEFKDVTVEQIRQMDNQADVAKRLTIGIQGLATSMSQVKDTGFKEEIQKQIDHLKALRAEALKSEDKGPGVDPKQLEKLKAQADKQIAAFTNTQEQLKRIELEAFAERLRAAGEFEKAKELLAAAETAQAARAEEELTSLQEQADSKIDILTLSQEAIEAKETASFVRRLLAAGEFDRANEILEANAEKRREKMRQRRVKAANAALTALVSLSTSKNKELALVGKSSAIARATISTFLAANEAQAALSGIPIVGPALGFAARAAITAQGLANVAAISGTSLGDGGVVLPTAGGTIARIAEVGKKEAVIPLDDEEAQEAIGESLGGGTTEININVGAFMGDPGQAREFAEFIDEELFNLDRNRQSVRQSP